MSSFVRLRKWKLTVLGLLALALCIDVIAKRFAADAMVQINTDSARAAGYTAAIGLLVALIGGICGIVSIAKVERGSVAPLIILGCSYVLVFLIMV